MGKGKEDQGRSTQRRILGKIGVHAHGALQIAIIAMANTDQFRAPLPDDPRLKKRVHDNENAV